MIHRIIFVEIDHFSSMILEAVFVHVLQLIDKIPTWWDLDNYVWRIYRTIVSQKSWTSISCGNLNLFLADLGGLPPFCSMLAIINHLTLWGDAQTRAKHGNNSKDDQKRSDDDKREAEDKCLPLPLCGGFSPFLWTVCERPSDSHESKFAVVAIKSLER